MNALEIVDGSLYTGLFIDATARCNYFTHSVAARGFLAEVGDSCPQSSSHHLKDADAFT
jgi:hypothetical protein